MQDLRVIDLSCAYQRAQKIMACLPSATLRPFNFIMYLLSVTLCVTNRLTNICTVAVQLMNRMTTKCSFIGTFSSVINVFPITRFIALRFKLHHMSTICNICRHETVHRLYYSRLSLNGHLFKTGSSIKTDS